MEPFIIDIKKLTLDNIFYRRVIHTTKDSQLVIMSLRPGEEISGEIHDGTQFIRVEAGQGEVTLDNLIYQLKDDIAVNIPGGVWHYVRAIGPDDLKIYIIYSPPVHPLDSIEYIDPETKQHRRIN